MSLRIDTSQAPRTYLELHELLLAVERAADQDESEWIEWKSSLDLNAKSTRATLARHIIGMANRRVEEAKRFVGGFGYVLVGVEPGNRCGVTPLDFADLRTGIVSYLGPHGPRWTGSYDMEDGPPVLIIVIDPPCDGDSIYTLHREFGKYRAGDVFVRKLGGTEKADPGDLDYLARRAAPSPEPSTRLLTRRRIITAVTAAGLSAAGWEIARNDSNVNTGSLARVLGGGSKIWSSPVPGIPSAILLGLAYGVPPVVAGHRIFVSTLDDGSHTDPFTEDGNHSSLYALRDSDGSQIWRMERPGNGGFSPPVIIGEILFQGTSNGEIHAIRASDGTELWSYTIAGGDGAVPVAGSGMVYVAGSELIAFRATDGSRLWRFSIASTEAHPPVLYTAGVVYAVGQDGRVYALQADRGIKIWEFTPLGTASIQAIAAGTLYVSSNNHIYALRANDGTFLWSFGAGGNQLTGIAVGAGTVFAGTEGYLYALRASDGKPLWRFPAKGAANILPAGRAVYLCTADGHVRALQADTGSEIWRFASGGNVQAGIVRAGSTIVLSAGIAYTSYRSGISVTASHAGVYGLRASDGKEIWYFRTGTLPGPPAVAGNVVYVWCYDGNLYAIRVLNLHTDHRT